MHHISKLSETPEKRLKTPTFQTKLFFSCCDQGERGSVNRRLVSLTIFSKRVGKILISLLVII